MLRWIRHNIDDLRFKLALLKGKRCPECHSADVGWSWQRHHRHCNACGFQWEQDSEVGGLPSSD